MAIATTTYNRLKSFVFVINNSSTTCIWALHTKGADSVNVKTNKRRNERQNRFQLRSFCENRSNRKLSTDTKATFEVDFFVLLFVLSCFRDHQFGLIRSRLFTRIENNWITTVLRTRLQLTNWSWKIEFNRFRKNGTLLWSCLQKCVRKFYHVITSLSVANDARLRSQFNDVLCECVKFLTMTNLIEN